MGEDREKEAMELDVLLERYDALVKEAKSLEAQVKLRRMAGGTIVPSPGGGYLSPYAMEARMLLLRMGITQEEAAIRLGMARGTLARKLTGFSKVHPEEIAMLRELARKMRKV